MLLQTGMSDDCSRLMSFHLHFTTSITFFAPDNKALTPHKKGKHHGATLSLSTIYDEYERLQTNARDDDDDEEKKRRFKKILRALLKYHTLPAALDKSALYANVTYETAWKAKDGSYDGQYRRISVGNSLLGKLAINFYVGVEWKSVAAENGEHDRGSI
jgi:Fasciclin domain